MLERRNGDIVMHRMQFVQSQVKLQWCIIIDHSAARHNKCNPKMKRKSTGFNLKCEKELLSYRQNKNHYFFFN